MKNIVLVGFMGTGKTATAKLLAKQLNKTYFCMDDEIEKRQGMKINDIFQIKGEPFFRGLEAELSKELADKAGLIIDAGGGAVLNKDNVKSLKKNGVMFCLTSTAEKILERTKTYSHRPLLSVNDPLGKIKELLKLREPYYRQANFSIDCNDLTVEQTAKKITELLKNVK